MSRFSHAFSLAATALILAVPPAQVAWSAPQEPPPAQRAASTQSYVETIPGTELKFEMVPIPGGTFLMGSPPSESNHGKDEEPQHPVQIAPFWMGSKEVTWDEYEQFAFSLDLKKKKRDAEKLLPGESDNVEDAKKAGKRLGITGFHTTGVYKYKPGSSEDAYRDAIARRKEQNHPC